MNNTSIGLFQNDNPTILARKAVGYFFSEKGFRKEPNMYLRMYPAGGMNVPLPLFAWRIAVKVDLKGKNVQSHVRRRNGIP